MRRLLKPSLFALVAALGLTVAVSGQGPLTAWANLGGRTDSNGYLLTSSGAYAAPDGPLTPMANLRVRTDANGYLITTASGTQTLTGPILVGDGTALLPAYSFTSEPTKGFWSSAAGTTTHQGALSITGLLQTVGGQNITAGGSFNMNTNGEVIWTSRTILGTAAVNGALVITNNARSIGSQFKVDALPTIASGFGGSPAITAGSTPLAGSVMVGTGGVAVTGVITWGGTAFPSAPFCTVTTTTTTTPTRLTATTTQITLNTTVAWLASDTINWICISSK